MQQWQWEIQIVISIYNVPIWTQWSTLYHVGLHSYDDSMDVFTKHITYNYIVKEVEKRINDIGGFILGFPLTMDIFVFNEVLWKGKGLITVMIPWILSFIEMNSSSLYLQC